MSNQQYDELLENFGRGNIEALAEKFAAQGSDPYFPEKATTMVHVNSHTDVHVTRENREACGDCVVRY